jgi:membrane protein
MNQTPANAKRSTRINKHRYNTPLFVLRETLSAFKLHNGWGLSASLSFYAMFAMIPMALMLFFFLSHMVFSSHHAATNLSNILSSFEPKLSKKIMKEVYSVARHPRAWGLLSTFALFWFAIPLASTLRSSFQTICAVNYQFTFLRTLLQDLFAVIGILMMFLMFTFFNLIISEMYDLLGLSLTRSDLFNSAQSLLIIAALLALFYRISLPIKVRFSLILIGSILIATLWMSVLPLFNQVLSANHSYGAIFGGMKNIFISLAWLYYSFAIFLLGTELISTMHNRDVLLLRGLFTENGAKNQTYLSVLMERYGKIYRRGDQVFKAGDTSKNLYFIVNGDLHLTYEDDEVRRLSNGDFFGEMAIVADGTRFADAVVDSEFCDIIEVDSKDIQSLILSEPKIAMNFLQHMALQLKSSHQASQTFLSGHF